MKGVTIYSSHVRFEIILSGLVHEGCKGNLTLLSFLFFSNIFFYFSNALRYPLYMPKSNVLSGGMKVFFSLLLAFFTSGCTIFPFVPLKRLSLGSWFCRTLLFFGIARIISTHSPLHKKFLYFETKLFITGTNPNTKPDSITYHPLYICFF